MKAMREHLPLILTGGAIIATLSVGECRTERTLNQQIDGVNQRIDDLGQKMEQGFAQVHRRIDDTNRRIDDTHRRLDDLGTQIGVVRDDVRELRSLHLEDNAQ